MGFYPGQLVLFIYPGFVYPETKPILEEIEKAAEDKLTSVMKMARSLGRLEVRFKYVKLLLSISGAWPLLTTLKCRILSVLTFVLITSQMIPEIIGFIEITDDLDKIIESLSPLISLILCIIKYINLAVNRDKIRRLLNKIQKDWDDAVFGQENIIMHRYAKIAFKNTSFYMIMLLIITGSFLLPPTIQSIPTWNPETNMTELKKKLPLIMDYYYIDQYKYSWYLTVHSLISVTYSMLIFIGADTLYFVCLQHGCAKFSCLNYELAKATHYQLGNLDEKLVYKNVQNCVILHQEAIKFATEIESIYNVSQLLQVGISCTMISINAFLSVTKVNNPAEMVRFFGVIFGVSTHLFIYSWPSQELMDQSESVCNAAYEMEWYQVSIPTRRIVLQIMTRSLDKTRITAGGLYLMSMENFTGVMAKAVSFFTVLSSVQEKLNEE